MCLFQIFSHPPLSCVQFNSSCLICPSHEPLHLQKLFMVSWLVPASALHRNTDKECMTGKRGTGSCRDDMKEKKTGLVCLFDCPTHLSNELQLCSLMSCV